MTCEIIEGCTRSTPHVHSVAGVDRDYTCDRCGATATDRWGRSRWTRSGFVHEGDGAIGCDMHPTRPGGGPHALRDDATGLPLGSTEEES